MKKPTPERAARFVSQPDEMVLVVEGDEVPTDPAAPARPLTPRARKLAAFAKKP